MLEILRMVELMGKGYIVNKLFNFNLLKFKVYLLSPLQYYYSLPIENNKFTHLCKYLFDENNTLKYFIIFYFRAF